jgi:hypothetical protein
MSGIKTTSYYLIDNRYYLLDMCDNTHTRTRHFIYCGGNEIQCVSIDFYLDSERANLDTVTYDSCCNKDKNMNRGAETVAMTLCALNYVLENYKNIEYFVLSDYSNRVCNYGVSLNNISMFHFSVAYHSSTFYEGVFGAVLEPKAHYRNYRDIVLQRLREPTIKQPINGLEYFNDYKLEIFNSSNTLAEFFDRLKTKYTHGGKLDTDTLCTESTNNDWLTLLLDKYVFLGGVNDYRDNWYIHQDAVERLKLNEKYIINWRDQKVVRDIDLNPKKATELKDYSVTSILKKAKELAAKKLESEQLAGQRSGTFKRLGVYLKTMDYAGNRGEVYLGEPHNYTENRDRFVRENPDLLVKLIDIRPVDG